MRFPTSIVHHLSDLKPRPTEKTYSIFRNRVKFYTSRADDCLQIHSNYNAVSIPDHPWGFPECKSTDSDSWSQTAGEMLAALQQRRGVVGRARLPELQRNIWQLRVEGLRHMLSELMCSMDISKELGMGVSEKLRMETSKTLGA